MQRRVEFSMEKDEVAWDQVVLNKLGKIGSNTVFVLAYSLETSFA